MKVLLDESVHVNLRRLLPGHDVATVSYLGWKGTKNGALVARACAAGFEVLVTTDRGTANQLNLTGRPIGIVILHAMSNSLDDLIPFVPSLLKELNHVTPGAFVHIRL